MGTPYYLCPEGLSGGEFSPLSDQYSLGVVMYECAAGRPPYKDVSLHELVQLIAKGDFKAPDEYNPRISKRLTRIITRAMSLDPALRYPDLRAMGRELLSLAGQRTRITWGLSFENGRAKTATPVNPSAPVSTSPVRRSNRSSLVKILPFALFFIGALVPLLIFGPWRPGGLAKPPVVITDDRPRDAASKPSASQPAVSQPAASQAMSRLAIKARPGVAADPEGSSFLQRSRAPARASSPSGHVGQPAKRVARTMPSAPDVSRRVSSPPGVPEWAPPTSNAPGVQSKARETRAVSNSNGAPIFD
jgi:serine/threonine-protein kinase